MFLYRWFTETSPRSWLAHLLVSLMVSWCAGLVALYAGASSAAAFNAFVLATVAMALLYSLKEWGDWRKYKTVGSWTKPRWNRISPAQDIWGDLLGPWAVALTAVSLRAVLPL